MRVDHARPPCSRIRSMGRRIGGKLILTTAYGYHEAFRRTYVCLSLSPRREREGVC